MKKSDEKYISVRRYLLNELKKDLIGPLNENEILGEVPTISYITGILYPQDIKTEILNEEIVTFDGDTSDNYSSFEEKTDDDEEESVYRTSFKKQSSLGITFYVNNEIDTLNVICRWGEYRHTKDIDDVELFLDESDDEENTKQKSGWLRNQHVYNINLTISNFKGNKKYKVVEGVYLKLISYELSGTNKQMVSLFLTNERNNDEEIENSLFQVEVEIKDVNEKAIFLNDVINFSDKVDMENFYYKDQPVFARGYGCAVDWKLNSENECISVKTNFLPEHEISSVSTELEEINKELLSMKFFMDPQNKYEVINRLKLISEKYYNWILSLEEHTFMDDKSYRDYGLNVVIKRCRDAYNRINTGIELLSSNKAAYVAFAMANQAMYMQRSMKEYSAARAKGKAVQLKDFSSKDHSFWRPFQIIFILLNLEGAINPHSNDRKIVDLLFFPTGGGKTEAYLGLAAFVIAHRRLTKNKELYYEKDGGVTIFLRYTLRLLTTQQRDRLMKMIVAMEIMRLKNPKFLGNEEISIGFWVGGGVTPNKFSELKITKNNDEKKVEFNVTKLTKQIIKCPCCGEDIKRDDYNINLDFESVEIKCPNEDCPYSKVKIPVYLVDEEIYRKCPTVIISTVDKFARLPWDEKTGLLFGRRDRYCTRHGNIAVGEEHKVHNRKGDIEKSKIEPVNPFYPPELIIQDELHLITGPLGTIYGGYETVIEELCSIEISGEKIKPKYVTSTATIKNADEQIRCLYGRKDYFQFPPKGHLAGDSFFAKEVKLIEKPFRLYTGICATGQSMKTTLLRTYSILLQATQNLIDNEEFKEYLDPYRTLIGYFNSTRELGGTVRLLDDDIPKRIKRINRKYKYKSRRYINRHSEITSRTPSFKIPLVLEQLESKMNEKNCLDVAIATNMIAVGMDVDRLGLMVITGQPKQSAEFIQASSRVGRSFPGLVVTVYNPYRPRDLSHYENFKAYHSQLYRFVEGTTATPFASRARDRVLHAIVIALLRLRTEEMAPNKGARKISSISNDLIEMARKIIYERVTTVEVLNRQDTMSEFTYFIDDWKRLNNEEKDLFYYIVDTSNYNRLINYYDKFVSSHEKPTLNSMREVESPAQLYYYTGEERNV